ncbi:hypothetical protein Tco_0293209, partial [Tanacetum coccineum]
MNYLGELSLDHIVHIEDKAKDHQTLEETNDRGNQAGNDRAPAKVYVVGNAGANPDNVVA